MGLNYGETYFVVTKTPVSFQCSIVVEKTGIQEIGKTDPHLIRSVKCDITQLATCFDNAISKFQTVPSIYGKHQGRDIEMGTLTDSYVGT